MAVVEFIKRVATFAGRSLEFALTGQSEYAVITSELADFHTVTDLPKAKRMLVETRGQLARAFQIEVREPVLLELFSGKDWTPASLRYVMRGAVGSYQPHLLGNSRSHTIHVLQGLPRGRFKAIVAHELVHAYQAEAGFLTSSRSLREGFARWVEYHVLLDEGDASEAKRLLGFRRWSAGRGIHALLDIEREGGIDAVLAHVRRVP